MPSLTQKTINGLKYYYARICKRVNGKPKIVQTVYLGSVERMISNASRSPTQTPKPSEVHVAEFGATAALFSIARRLGVVDLIDAHAPKRDQGASTGQYLLLAAINRAIRPLSKASLAEWFARTVGPRLFGIAPKQLSSQAFWNHMHRLTPDALRAIENDLLHRLVVEFKLDLNCLIYDATNFHTYINTRTDCPIAQRGHNKQKRNDLRQVSLGMMTTADFNIPLLHMVYGGNITDAPQFGTIIDELINRYRALTAACPHITLVFDKGNNSETNLDKLPQTGFHFVGSLRSNQCADLLRIPMRRFHPLTGDDLKDVQAFRIQRAVFSAERTVLVTFNPNLLNGQLQGISRNLAKTRADLHELQTQLQRWADGAIRHGRKPTLAGVQAKVRQFLTREHMTKLIAVDIQEDRGYVRLHYTVNPDALARLSRTVLGKTILFTDNHAWSDEQIVHAYRAQYHIEHGFRDMKNPLCLGWDPRFHWTELHIRVHAFYCVLALMLVSLLRRNLAEHGLSFSAERLIQSLSAISESLIVYPGHTATKPRIVCSLNSLTPTQKQLVSILQLDQLLSV